MIADDGCQTELGILIAALNHNNPEDAINSIPTSLTLESKEFLKEAKRSITEFLDKQNAEVNDNVILPNIEETQLLYLVNDQKLPMLATTNVSAKSTQKSLDAIKALFKFIHSNKEYSLMYLRGKVHGKDKNVILTMDPNDRESMILMQTPASEVNVTELMALMGLELLIDDGWTVDGLYNPLGESHMEKKVVEEEEWVEKEVQEEVELDDDELDEEPEDQPKKGLWGRIKSLFGGGSSSGKRTKIVTKTVREKVTTKVKKKVAVVDEIGIGIPDYLAKAMGIIALSDLRLYEMFDTFREAEYTISGTLFSDFAKNTTSFMGTNRLDDPGAISSVLDGLDEVVERVISHYFGDQMEIIPTEILFTAPGDKRVIICLDGTDSQIVGTIAQTFSKDITNWQEKDEEDVIQRRSLHMRTGQLLSALNHTPFDRAAERIYKFDLDKINDIKIDHAILKID